MDAPNELDASRRWVIERLRFPQRSPRTTAVFDWTAVSVGTQRTVAGLAATIPDPTEVIAEPRWWQALTGQDRGYRQLPVDQRAELRRAYTALHWPLREEGTEIRAVAIAENVVDRIIGDPAWAHPLLDGHRSVLGFTIELHMIAAAAHELLRVRVNTPPRPSADGSDQLVRVRAEWERRQVVAAQAQAGLVDRVAALRAYEQALSPIGDALRRLQAVNDLSTGGGDVDRVYHQITGTASATADPLALHRDLDDVRADLDAQVAYLDSLVGAHRNA